MYTSVISETKIDEAYPDVFLKSHGYNGLNGKRGFFLDDAEG